MSDDKYLSKIAGLLRQAESTKNDDEAAAYMAAAQRLATATSISLEVARQHQANKEKRESPIQKRITIGTDGKKGLKYYVRLFTTIANQNDVTCNMAHNSTYVVAFGFPSDIHVTELLYASLVTQMVEASDRYLRSGDYKRETMKVETYESEYDYWKGRNVRVFAGYKEKPVDGRVARSNFMESFIQRISARLFNARQEAITEAKVIEQEAAQTLAQSQSPGTDIVLANKALEVADFYKQNSTARGTWKGYSRSKGYSSRASSAGREAGERARISSQVAIGGSRRELA